jgi:malonyl-CoA decarboxylase
VLAQFAHPTPNARLAFFKTLASSFGPDHARLTAAVEAWRQEPTGKATVELSAAVEPRRQELFRRLNLAPGGPPLLVEMRRQFLESTKGRDDLAAIDADFAHLFASWFNRGILLMRRIDWSTFSLDPGKDCALRSQYMRSTPGTTCVAASSHRTGAARPSSTRRWSTNH